MPADFLKCVADYKAGKGGKMDTKVSKDGKKYIHLCKDRFGKWHSGEVKQRESNK